MGRKSQGKKGLLKDQSSRRANDHSKGRPETSKELAKVTLYVRPDQVIAIEEIQLRERKSTGIRPDKSALVQQALDLLIKKYRIGYE
jgi:hypothetical protein